MSMGEMLSQTGYKIVQVMSMGEMASWTGYNLVHVMSMDPSLKIRSLN